MFDDSFFQKLVDNGNPTGEVVGSDRFLVDVKGLEGVGINSLVVFESGQRGLVRSVEEDVVRVMNLETEDTRLGTL
ncbi:MAG TPA: sodium-transporting two-sector ATPase, partial [Candidatus Saccharimonadales bacterium]|nr:sodium-transporting two-sector ATPase [Candidatus Saccharimonadales bacterium]